MYLFLPLIIFGLSQGIRADVCPPTGISWLPHYSNCRLFFECENGTKTIMECAEYLLFDKETLRCVDEKDADCSYITTTTKPDNRFCPEDGVKYYPHLADCTLYFQCLNGNLTLEKCPYGYGWSIQEEACVLIETADCSYTTGLPSSTPPAYTCPTTGNSFLPDYGDCTAYYQCEAGREIHKYCPKNRRWNQNTNICDFPENVICNYDVCPPTGVTIFPDFGDCASYFICNNGKKTHHVCPTGQAFDILVNNCDDIANVNCNYTTTSTSTTPTPITPPQDQCPATGTDFLPDPYDCHKYYECRDGKKISRQCLDGFAWDIVKKSCEDELIVDCGYTSTISTIAPTIVSTTTRTTTTTELQSTTKDPPTTETTVTTTKPTTTTEAPTTTKLPTTTETTITTTKPTTTTEAPTTTKLPTTTETTITTTKPTTTTEAPTTTKLPTTTETTITTTKPTTTTETPTTTKSSTTTESPTSTKSPTSTGTTADPFCPDPTRITYHAHPYNCTLFYECHYGKRKLMSCLPGYSWNAHINVCDVTSAVDCSYTSISTDTVDVTKPMSYSHNFCANESTGTLLPHPTNCRKFIECSEGQDIVKFCEDGTSWNEYLETCNNNEFNCETNS